MPSKWKPALPPIAWRDWLEQGVGFLLLWLVYLVGMNAVRSLERRSIAELAEEGADDAEAGALASRFRVYRILVRLASLSTAAALAVWLVRQHP
jgi:hypothetical protein